VIGLLVLGPILVNILAFHLFIMKGEGLGNPVLLAIVGIAWYLVWADRLKWSSLIG